VAVLIVTVEMKLGADRQAGFNKVYEALTKGRPGSTVPLVLKCTKKLYTSELIGVGASVNTTAAGIFAGISQPVIGFAMLAASHVPGESVAHAGAAIGDAGYGALIGILLLMSLPGIAGPLLMRSKLIVR